MPSSLSGRVNSDVLCPAPGMTCSVLSTPAGDHIVSLREFPQQRGIAGCDIGNVMNRSHDLKNRPAEPPEEDRITSPASIRACGGSRRRRAARWSR